MEIKPLKWRIDYRNNAENMRALIDAHELFSIERHDFKTSDHKFLLIIRIGRPVRLKGDTVGELKEFSEKYYQNFLRAIGINEEQS